MKLSLTLSVLFSITLLFNCGDSKDESKPAHFSFDNQSFKKIYHSGDTLKLVLKKQKDVSVDSVYFFINGIKINENHVFSDEKLGYQKLKAQIFYNGRKYETTSRVELASNISPKLINYTLVNTFPHDINAYTQGLEFHKDTLIESTGLNGKSSIRKTNARSGKIYKNIPLENKFFGEGITVINDQLFQLTYKQREGFIYDINTLKKIKTFPYHKNMEGWGLCNDGSSIYFSDGSEKIYVLDPITLTEKRSMNVYTNNNKIKSVNELEYINGKIFANIYQKSAIVIIDPKTGAVEGIINLTDLKKKVAQHPQLDVLNGIAYYAKTNTIFVTGKNWNKMFEIKLDE